MKLSEIKNIGIFWKKRVSFLSFIQEKRVRYCFFESNTQHFRE